MKAAYYQGKKTFEVKETEISSPGEGEVQINVAYCGICGTDLHIYHGSMDTRVQPPEKIIGHEMSGKIAAVGPGVDGFSVDDPVVVRPLDNRGEKASDRGYSHICENLKFIGIDSPGAFQTVWNVPAFTLHKLPPSIDLKLAALTEPLAVACHDIRMGKLKAGEHAVVLGGGPIGMLVALAAKDAGAKVLLSEINPHRLSIASELGIDTVNPQEAELLQTVKDRTGGIGADIVFEVSGSPFVAKTMTELPAIRGRIVVVAIYPNPVEIDLFKFFWRELKLIGARVYEPEDYEKAIQLISSGSLPFEKLITKVESLDNISAAFAELDGNPEAMKVLIDCQS